MAEFSAAIDVSDLQTDLRTLTAQKELLEIEAEALHDDLTSPGPNGEPAAGVKDTLIDSDGFPRGDIDLLEVRKKRNRLAVINTDHRALMSKIQEKMLQLHAAMSAAESSAINPSIASAESKMSETNSSGRLMAQYSSSDNSVVSAESSSAAATAGEDFSWLPAIAVLDEVLASSPAAEAGIMEGDLLLQFGEVTAASATPLQAIPAVVRSSINQPIKLIVKRREAGDSSAIKKIELTPRAWGGRGLLGCHLSPL